MGWETTAAKPCTLVLNQVRRSSNSPGEARFQKGKLLSIWVRYKGYEYSTYLPAPKRAVASPSNRLIRLQKVHAIDFAGVTVKVVCHTAASDAPSLERLVSAARNQLCVAVAPSRAAAIETNARDWPSMAPELKHTPEAEKKAVESALEQKYLRCIKAYRRKSCLEWIMQCPINSLMETKISYLAFEARGSHALTVWSAPAEKRMRSSSATHTSNTARKWPLDFNNPPFPVPFPKQFRCPLKISLLPVSRSHWMTQQSLPPVYARALLPVL